MSRFGNLGKRKEERPHPFQRCPPEACTAFPSIVRVRIRAKNLGMPDKTRQQRRAEAREAAKLLVQGEPRPGFRWGHTVALLGAAAGVVLVLDPPETPLAIVFWLAVMFGTLIYPTLHMVRAVLGRGVRRFQVPLALFLLGGLVALFSWRLFRPTPIELQFSSTVPLYGPESDVSGIRWDDKYSELRLLVRNLSDVDYDNFDLALTSDLMFVDLRQENGLASCVIAPEGEPFPNATSQKLVGGRPNGPVDTSGENYKAVAVDADGQVISVSGNIKRTYRVRCEKFPSHNQNSFVGGLVAINPFLKSKPPKELFGTPRAASQLSAKISFKVSRRQRNAAIVKCKVGQICKS